MGKRVFVAVVPPLDVREDLAAFLARHEGPRWASAGGFHLTLAFLADVPEPLVAPLTRGLTAAVAELAPFACSLAGAGAFPTPARPSVLWMGVGEGLDGLVPLAQRVQDAAKAAGTTPDDRRFVPHLTVARLRRGPSALPWMASLDAYRSRRWTVDEVALIDSQRPSGGGPSVHEQVAHFALRAPALGG